MIFGQTSTPMYKWLKFGRNILLACLIRYLDARIDLPTNNEVRLYQEAIAAK